MLSLGPNDLPSTQSPNLEVYHRMTILLLHGKVSKGALQENHSYAARCVLYQILLHRKKAVFQSLQTILAFVAAQYSA